MKVEFTDFAKNELQTIYGYYESVASSDVALKIISRILDEVETLERLPNIGAKEVLLEELGMNHRYIVCGNYKIIFYSTTKVVYVTDIFDCRQNPEKMVERNR
jgi:plasmid stabilization system protein ParE